MIIINAPGSVVWDALVNPEKTKVYMFGCETVSDWQVGSDLLWRGQHEGREMVFVKGKILEINPETFLKYTVIDPFAAYPDVPKNYLNVTYEIIPQGTKTTLIISQDGFETAAEGEKRYTDVYNNGEGWNPILIEIKKLVEGN
ncbi:MAG: SRPBCC domain-containing protein [Janthinobacterium lividum]